MILVWVWRYRSLEAHEVRGIEEACSYSYRDDCSFDCADCSFDCAEVDGRIITGDEAGRIYGQALERYAAEREPRLPIVRWLWLRHPSADRWSLHRQFTEVGEAEAARTHLAIGLGDERVMLLESPLHPPETHARL
jgi:hypothetical protein